MKGRGESLLVCNVYRPPNANAEWMDDVEAMIENALTVRMTVVVLGDFNCDMLRPNFSGRRLQMMMAEYGLTQLIDGPTRVTENSSAMLDLLFSTDIRIFEYVGCDELSLSDHDLVFGRLRRKVRKIQHNYRDVRCWGKCDVEQLNDDLRSVPWQVAECFDDVDSKWEYWKDLFWKIVGSHAPAKKARVKRKSAPWINGDIQIMMRARLYYHKKAKKSGKIENWKAFEIN